MFPLIAIAAFFILGIAFFIIGKDDFGIKRVKEVSNNVPSNAKEIINEASVPNDTSFEGKKELVKADSPSEDNSGNNETDQ